MMIEILKEALNQSVALFFAILFYWDFRKKVNKMEVTVANDSKNTAENTKTTKSLKNTIENHLVHSIDGLTKEIRRMNEKK